MIPGGGGWPVAIPTGIEDRKKCGGRTKEGGLQMAIPPGAGGFLKNAYDFYKEFGEG